MLNKQDKETLKNIARDLNPLVQIGKGGLTDNQLQYISSVLDNKEIVKIRFLRNTSEEKKQAGEEICATLHAEEVMAIGNVIVIYRFSHKEGIEHIL